MRYVPIFVAAIFALVGPSTGMAHASSSGTCSVQDLDVVHLTGLVGVGNHYGISESGLPKNQPVQTVIVEPDGTPLAYSTIATSSGTSSVTPFVTANQTGDYAVTVSPPPGSHGNGNPYATCGFTTV